MRNKIEELRNREEGFTLVELLAVIVILGIIVAIAIPAVGRVTNTAQEGASEAEVALVEDAARLYVLDNDNAVPTNNQVNVSDLVKEGYLEETNSTNIDTESGFVYVDDLGNGNYTYEYNGTGTPTPPATGGEGN